VLRALGASPMALPFGEIYQALEKGVVDASEARFDSKNPFLGVVKGGSVLTSFQQGQGFLVANESAWVALLQRERAAIQAAATDARNQARTAVLRTEASVPDLARNYGLSHTSFSTLGNDQNLVRSTWLKRAGGEGPDALRLFDQVLREQPSIPPAPPASSPGGAIAPRVFFATNRNDEGGGDLSYRFGVARSKALVCGEVQYAADPARSFGLAHDKAISVVASRTVMGPANCSQLIAPAASAASGGLILFIHGYNNSFSFAVRRAIAFAQDFGVGTPVLVFSWPSLDEVSGYTYDLGSVTYSRPFAKDLIQALFSQAEVRGISLLAHSMGSQIAFQVLEYASPSIKSLDTVVFVAPDVPRDNFIQGIQLYGAKTRLATLYANAHDRALLVSQAANRQAPAGMGGAGRLLTEGVETVDVSEVDRQWNQANHSHGFDVRKVANDVSIVLRQQSKASVRNLQSAVHDGMTYWLIRP
jgi:esterase/lipase superfamily enzyme